MKFVNPHNVRHLVPSWVFDPFHIARAVDAMLAQNFAGKKLDPYRRLNFWIEIVVGDFGLSVRMATPVNDDEQFFAGTLCIDAKERSLVIPLNAILKGHEKIRDCYSLYAHTFQVDTPLTYIGLTKRPWFERLSQHRSDAGRGSNLLFHRAIREHSSVKMVHRVFLAGVDHSTAMQMEEEFIENMSLYPLGLNMIPGGFAGIKYLGSLGFRASSAETRDELLQDLVEKPSLAGVANPLCAARWEADQEFVNRVICGHSGRLTVDQVRTVRMLAASGKPAPAIAQYVHDNEQRIKQVIAGSTYARVA